MIFIPLTYYNSSFPLWGVVTTLQSVTSSPSLSSQLIQLCDHLLKAIRVVAGLLIHRKALAILLWLNPFSLLGLECAPQMEALKLAKVL